MGLPPGLSTKGQRRQPALYLELISYLKSPKSLKKKDMQRASCPRLPAKTRQGWDVNSGAPCYRVRTSPPALILKTKAESDYQQTRREELAPFHLHVEPKDTQSTEAESGAGRRRMGGDAKMWDR